MTDQPRLGPIDHARTAQQARQTGQAGGRHTVDTITSDALDQLYREIDTLTAVCRSNKQAYIGAVKDAMAATQRAERDEAAIERVRALAHELITNYGQSTEAGRDILAALDPQEPQSGAES